MFRHWITPEAPLPWMSERRTALARSGSQNRKRSHKRAAALTDEEAKAFDALADRAGISVSSLIRCTVLGQPLSRATRHPTINHQMAARLLIELGRLTEAYRQAAATVPDNGKYDALLQAACRDLSEMRVLLMQATGRSS